MILVASIGLDQVTKLLVRTHFQVGESKSLIDGLLSLTYVMNRGAAFGVLSGQYRFLVCFPLLVSVGILVAAMFMKLPEISRITMVFIAAGGLSNALDRIFLGYVTDMIAVSFFPPVFNVADMYVTVGCVCLALSILFSSDKANRKEAQP
jgi:signal peptidase II